MTAKTYALEQRPLAKAFLIICEGENTEPQYFKSFPLGNASVENYGTGASKTALVNQVLETLASDADAGRKEVWVVFDFDIKHDQVKSTFPYQFKENSKTIINFIPLKLIIKIHI